MTCYHWQGKQRHMQLFKITLNVWTIVPEHELPRCMSFWVRFHVLINRMRTQIASINTSQLTSLVMALRVACWDLHIPQCTAAFNATTFDIDKVESHRSKNFIVISG
ncbi:predicted protein [Sclerotinia sclerotiorum 1980 UF-70]|uniref:Uncharacterized protein n=1 Tax=Sclerotinia sclerotiorum (strain ATCC 18683 / 1980 / Ss-1) TaxID=665079 RepID=A7E5W4_SCLS1|nr:predicted protein [Sclerotinia sclerotiorum 1980 UF-70]EDN91286.1 predicted protein [Sclerotinia sclerotiorum 1980 UF-70]